MTRFFLSLGSNINPQINIPAAMQVLRESFTVRKISSVYETQPVGPAGKDNFWNLAVEIETTIDRTSLVKRLRDIETQLGRKRNPADKYAPRTIDIDLLPQPGYQKQAFIMLPLAEIAPQARDSATGENFSEIAERLRLQASSFRKVALNSDCL
ncbi:MAG: 2-amino-4-hydroxy-6-hydroxymethyldihydropteridine diphosphokinase [Candidatus Omnitrophica bacterium]|nr:2-amino-4-hydroxy-6-hydroxymethyldihydropteridine diphosphokinase [Candidatus Omnitrophota bacterium]MDD5670121.1 2-amino-4-hydroxy-6-hydroxymethyldihydropteridine diphosphokinase [Candidatus Omnitrophota bacterium]